MPAACPTGWSDRVTPSLDRHVVGLGREGVRKGDAGGDLGGTLAAVGMGAPVVSPARVESAGGRPWGWVAGGFRGCDSSNMIIFGWPTAGLGGVGGGDGCIPPFMQGGVSVRGAGSIIGQVCACRWACGTAKGDAPPRCGECLHVVLASAASGDDGFDDVEFGQGLAVHRGVHRVGCHSVLCE